MIALYVGVVQTSTYDVSNRLSPCPNSPLPLDLSPNPRFCAFLQWGRVTQYLREQGGVLFSP